MWNPEKLAKNKSTTPSSDMTPLGICSKILHTEIQGNMYFQFHCTLFTLAHTWKKPKSPWIDDWISKM
jgi:hypothetical protein